MDQPVQRYRLGAVGWAAVLPRRPGAPGGAWCKPKPETASAVPFL